MLCHPQPQPGHLEKFGCEVMSLSVLLDYEMTDRKRHSFEVSLFAELFNDMLMRDFGFTIYKSMSQLAESVASGERARREADHPKSDPEEPAEKKYRKSDAGEQGESSRTSKRTDSAKKSETDTKSESKDREKSSGGGAGSSSNSSRDKEKRERERRPSRRDEETEEEKAAAAAAAKSRETKKMVTVEPDLLLAFVYFDRGHCGYIFNNHLDDLLQSMGLLLTRRETKDLLNRVAPRALFYR